MNKNDFLSQENDFLKLVYDMKEFCSDEEICNTLINDSMKILPNGEYKKQVLEKIIEKQNENISYKNVELYLSEDEFCFIKKIKNNLIKKMFFGLVCYYKLNWHYSGYVKFNIKEISNMCFNKKELNKININKLFKEMYETLNNIEMRVLGKKDSIVCFKINNFSLDGNKKYTVNSNDILDFYKRNFL